MVVGIAVTGWALEQVSEGTVVSVTPQLDKNGNENVRIIVNMKRSLQGEDYETGYAWMAFGDLAEPAKAYTEGQAIKAITQTRFYEGGESFTIIKFMQ